MEKPFKTSAQISKVQTLADGGNKLSVLTQELDFQERAKMFEYVQEQGWLLFSPEEPEKDDIPDTSPPQVKKDNKSMSQKLREVIYIKQKQELGRKPNDQEAESYYESYMRKLIQNIKDKID